MNLTLSNDELLAFTEMVEQTVAKYRGMIEDMRNTNRKRVLAGMPPEDNDFEINEAQLQAAIFESMLKRFRERAITRQPKYGFEFTPVWAFAIRLEYNGLVDITTQIGNSIQRLCNAVDQYYL